MMLDKSEPSVYYMHKAKMATVHTYLCISSFSYFQFDRLYAVASV